MSTETPENQKPLQITSVEAIKQRAKEIIQDGVLVELPSGLVVRLRRPSIQVMLRTGQVPSNLIGVAMKMMEGKTPLDQKSAEGFIDVTNTILTKAFVEPVFSLEPQEGEIGPEDLTDDDKGFAFRYVYVGSKKLETFRNQ